jgi:DNA-binding transcriptional MerR regulator
MSAAPHSPAATDAEDVSIGIAEMAESSGLTQDTLRWYEREGLIPEIPRTAMGRRAFSPRLVALVKLLVRLRTTGMPTADMRRFVILVNLGASTHQERIDILTAHRVRVEEKQRRLAEARSALESKISHYEDLIAQGLDCDGLAVVTPSFNEHRSIDVDSHS